MHQDKVTLTMQDILEHDFKIDTRGYRMQEVDQFLDIIIRDYNEYLEYRVTVSFVKWSIPSIRVTLHPCVPT